MPNARYRKGDHFEKRVADNLEIDGYAVWQTRGSKGAADLLAVKPGQLLLVQVKSLLAVPGVETMDHDGWNTLYELANQLHAVPIVADRTGPAGRVIRYRRITAPHMKHMQQWPAVVWAPDAEELAAAIRRHPAGRGRP